MSENKPLVSVVLPAFNRKEKLRESVKSVLSQSYRNLELILVDDCSDEEISVEMIEANDKRVRIVRHATNQGAAAARNTGLTLAHGEYVAFQDSDDFWLPGKLEVQVKILDSLPNQVAGIIGGRILYGRDRYRSYGPGKVAYLPDIHGTHDLSFQLIDRSLLQSQLSLQASLFRARNLAEAGGFDPLLRANEDWDLSIRVLARFQLLQHYEPVVISFLSKDSISLHPHRNSLATLRILNKNKGEFASDYQSFGRMLLTVSRQLQRVGKSKYSRRLLWMAFLKHPRLIFHSPVLKLNKTLKSTVLKLLKF